jgi:Seed maturation protein
VPYAQTGGQNGGGGQGNYAGEGSDGGDDEGSDQQNADNSKLTIGEALEATARAIGNEPIQPSDAAAISAAETTACGADGAMPGGIGDAAIAAASANVWATHNEEKIKLSDIISVCYFSNSFFTITNHQCKL